MQKSFVTSLRIPLKSLLVLALFLQACGEDSKKTGSGSGSYSGTLVKAYEPVPRKTIDVAVDAGKLIAADAVVVARVRKIGDLIQKTKAIAESFQPGAGQFVDVTPLLQMAGLRLRDVDMTGSPLVALNLTVMGPAPSFIVPVTNAEDAAGITHLPSAVSGKYLGLSMGVKPVVGESTPDIAAGMPDADYAIRVNLKALVSQFKPMIEQYLDPEALARLDPSVRRDPTGFAMLGMMIKGVKKFLDVAERLDIGVSLNGGALDLDFALDLGGEGTATASGRGVTLARMLPMSNASMYVIFDTDWSELIDWVMPMYENMAAAMPAEQGKSFMKIMRSSLDLYKGMKGGGAFALDFTTDGIQGMGMMENDDPAAYVERYVSFMGNYEELIDAMMPGANFMKVSPATNQTIDGVAFRWQTMKMDFAAAMKVDPRVNVPEEILANMSDAMDSILGKGGMQFGVGVYENLVLMTVGDVNVLATSLVAAVKNRQLEQSPLLEHAAKRLHARPSYFVGTDLRRVFRQIQPTISKVAPMPIPVVPAGDPVIVWMSAAATKRGYEFQAHIDLAGIAQLVQAMKQR